MVYFLHFKITKLWTRSSTASLVKSWWFDRTSTQIKQPTFGWMEWRAAKDPNGQNEPKFSAPI